MSKMSEKILIMLNLSAKFSKSNKTCNIIESKTKSTMISDKPTAMELQPIKNRGDVSDQSSNGGNIDNQQSNPSHGKLERQITLFSGTTVIVGVIIGSGIFISPVDMLIGTKSVGVSLLMWVICGIISLFGALCFSELGCHIRDSGALYIYIQKGMGDFWGFHLLWAAMFIMYPAANTAIALTSAKNFLQVAYLGCDEPLPDSSVVMLSMVILSFITVINLKSVKLSNKIQDLTTILKVLILLVIIFIGVYNICTGKFGSLSNAFVGSSRHISGQYVTSLYNGLFAYAGWYSLNFLTEELVNPFVNLPRAIYLSMPFVMIIYVLTNVAYFTELTVDEVINSNAVAVSFAFKISKYFAYTIPFFVAASTFGSLNGCMLSVPRMYFVGGRYNHLPEMFSFINSTKTPGFSIIFTGITSCCFLFTTKTSDLIVALTFVESLAIFACICVLVVLRRRPAAKQSPIRVHSIIVYSFLVLQFLIVLAAIIYEPFLSFIGCLFVFSGVPFYYFFVYKKNHFIKLDVIIQKFNHVYQKFFMAVVETKD